MRIGPFHIARAAYEPTSGQPKKELGASGTVNQSGFLLADEYNSDLRHPRSLNVFDRMRRSDGTVREALWHIFAPILNATRDIEPAGDDPIDLEVAEFSRQALFEWPIDPYQQTLRQKLGHLTTGFQVFELVEQVLEAELTWEDPKTGQPVTAPRRQFVCWRQWGHRKPSTIWKWNAPDGELVSITQQVWKDQGYETPEIPAEDLVVFTNEKEGDEFTGMSLLRTSYKAWYLKELIEKVMGVAYERHGRGIDTYYVPEDVKNDDAVLDRIEEMAKGNRAGEFNYQVFPGPKGMAPAAGGGNGGFWYEIVTPLGGFPDFSVPLEYLRGEIKGSVLARFAELGHAATGARATADVQSQVWYDALHAVARYIEDVTSDALRRLIQKNYSVDRFPRLVFRDIEARSLTEFADFIAKTAAVNALLPDKSLRQAVRKTGGLPDEDEPDSTDVVPPPIVEPDTGPPPAPPAPAPPPAPPKPVPAAA